MQSCSFSAQSPNLTIIGDFDSPASNASYLSTRVEDHTGEIFKFNRTDQLVSSSYCHIASLEVYRGREQAIEISHEGFSLNQNGNIEVKMLLQYA